MKWIIFLLVFVSIVTSNAKVWRVDNNATNKPDFTSLQAAYDASSAGDTLYIAGHGNSYGSLEISKQIVIIGSGYFLDQNLNGGVNPFESKIEQISFKSGAENSIIMSCILGLIRIECNNIILERNLINGLPTGTYSSAAVQCYTTCSGIKIQQCFIKCSISLQGDNFYINNNYILGNSNFPTPFAISISSSGFIRNNVIKGLISITGMIFENNIIEGSISDYSQSSIIRNNLGYESQVDWNTIFTLTGNEDAKYILKEGSPAKGAGVNGVDCGMFGGDEPYILSGIPPIPTIYEATVPSTVTNKDGLPVQIKARANK